MTSSSPPPPAASSLPPRSTTPSVHAAAWSALRRFTDARIALGRAGHSLPTQPHLAFQLAHAQARDAVHLPFDAAGTADGLRALGLDVLMLHSAAADRATYLQRPDLGRRLDDASVQALAAWRGRTAAAAAPAPSPGPAGAPDLALVVADGLSALAVHQNAVPLAAALLARLGDDARAGRPWQLAPAAVVGQGRVAVGDPVGEGLGAAIVVVMIGERPGLSSPDSLGLYMTWQPRTGMADAQRNCISNVRPAGLAIDAAAAKLHQMLTQMRERRLSGVGLKDDTDDAAPRLAADGDAGGAGRFLLDGPPV